MIQEIEIGGALRPVRFSFAALYEYEKNTGRNAIADFSLIQHGDISVMVAADLLFAGLSLGAKSAGKRVDFTPYDVSDWAFEEKEAMEKAMEIFSESFPKPDAAVEVGEAGKKRKAPQPGTT